MSLKPVPDWEGNDLSDVISAISAANDCDEVALLALLKAESGLRRKAERYGTRTNEFLSRLLWFQRGDSSQWGQMQQLIYDVWMDVSFGYGQQIVRYHYYGDQTSDLDNVLAVREHVFTEWAENIEDACRRLVAAKPRSLDDTWLGAMVVYNAGSDRRNDPEWMARWAGNVAAYQAALEWAASFKVTEEDDMPHGPVTIPSELWTFVQKPEFKDHLNQIIGVANELDSLRHGDFGGRIRERVAAIYALFGFTE